MEASHFLKPWTVESALYVLSAALIAGVLRAVFGVDLSAMPIDPLLFYGLLLGSSAVVGLLLYKIGSRKNWARITYTSLLVLGMFKTLPALATAFDVSVVGGVFSAALITAKLGAVVLLFLPLSNAWFRHDGL